MSGERILGKERGREGVEGWGVRVIRVEDPMSYERVSAVIGRRTASAPQTPPLDG